MILAFLLIGCDELSQFIPTVTFDRMEVRDIDFDRIDSDFVFRVDNPNPIGAPVDRFNYAFALEDVEIVSGNDPNGLELVADGSSELALPVGLVFENIYDAITATRGEDFVGFGLAGGFGFDTDLGPVDVSFDEDGEFPALRVPRFNLGKLHVQSVDTSKVEFGLDVGIDNDHGSTLDFSEIGFAMAFGGVEVGRGALDDTVAVDGASSRTVRLPISVDYVDAAEALYALASGDRMNLELDASMDVDTPFGVLPLHIDETGNIEVVEQ
jgi:LEA14-like dessication related protein